MTRIGWDAIGSRTYQGGIDRGVLYVSTQPGVPWSGLTSVTENSSGGVAKPLYLDGDKFSNLATPEEYDATLTAYTYPDEFEVCDGTVAARSGVLVTRQKRKPFGLSYRTLVGNDITPDFGYKIHLIYNVTAAPSTHSYKSTGQNVDVNDFNWKLTSLPPVTPGYKRTAHVILDSTDLTPEVLAYAEGILYGTDTTLPRLPSLIELVDLVDTDATLVVVDNGDGTFTVTAPMASLIMVTPSVAQITWSTATPIDANTYSISSP